MPTVNRYALALKVRELIQSDEDECPMTLVASLIDSSLNEYSIENPAVLSSLVSGDGTAYYSLSNLTGFAPEFSRVLAVEYPAEATPSSSLPVYLNDDRYSIYVDGSTYKLALSVAPSVGEYIRIHYTSFYAFDSDSDVTLPAGGDTALLWLVAANVCQAIAGKYARTNDSTVLADSVNHAGRYERFIGLAREYRKAYRNAIDGKRNDDTMTPFGSWADLDVSPGFPIGRNFLFRGRKTR